MAEKIKIVILGGGYAGVTAATSLRAVCRQHGCLSITLVNKHNYHYFTTLLHQCVGRRGYKDISVDLPTLLGPEVNFRRGEVVAIKPKANRVEIKSDENRQTLDTAQIAFQHGKVVAKNFQRRLTEKAQLSFTPKVLGTFLTLGRKDALGVIQNKYRFSGWVARTMKNLIAYRYLWGIGRLGLPLRKFLDNL